MPSIGDNFVATSAEIAFGRAAGMVPFLPPELAARFPEYREYATAPALFAQLGQKTPNQILAETYTTEGIPRLERTPAGPACRANLLDAPDCQALPWDPAACKQALYDVDWVSEGKLPFDQQHPAVPLRLARRAELSAADPASLDHVWEPRLAGAPFAETSWTPGAPLMAQLHMYSDPLGAHAWSGGPCSVWDPQTYALAVVTRFLATEGRDLFYVTRPRGHQCLVDRSCEFFAK